MKNIWRYEENLVHFYMQDCKKQKFRFRSSDQCFGTVGPSVRPYSISMPCLGLTFQGASICGGPRAWEGREWRLVKKSSKLEGFDDLGVDMLKKNAICCHNFDGLSSQSTNIGLE